MEFGFSLNSADNCWLDFIGILDILFVTFALIADLITMLNCFYHCFVL